MIVGKYYKDEKEEKRQRKEMQREYNDMLARLMCNRWDTAAGQDANLSSAVNPPDEKKRKEIGPNVEKDGKTANLLRTNSVVSSHTEYYLQRTYVQMAKNANLMSYIVTDEMMKPNFPRKV
jgi:hypothetical protein